MPRVRLPHHRRITRSSPGCLICKLLPVFIVAVMLFAVHYMKILPEARGSLQSHRSSWFLERTRHASGAASPTSVYHAGSPSALTATLSTSHDDGLPSQENIPPTFAPTTLAKSCHDVTGCDRWKYSLRACERRNTSSSTAGPSNFPKWRARDACIPPAVYDRPRIDPGVVSRKRRRLPRVTLAVLACNRTGVLRRTIATWEKAYGHGGGSPNFVVHRRLLLECNNRGEEILRELGLVLTMDRENSARARTGAAWELVHKPDNSNNTKKGTTQESLINFGLLLRAAAAGHANPPSSTSSSSSSSNNNTSGDYVFISEDDWYYVPSIRRGRPMRRDAISDSIDILRANDNVLQVMLTGVGSLIGANVSAGIRIAPFSAVSNGADDSSGVPYAQFASPAYSGWGASLGYGSYSNNPTLMRIGDVDDILGAFRAKPNEVEMSGYVRKHLKRHVMACLPACGCMQAWSTNTDMVYEHTRRASPLLRASFETARKFGGNLSMRARAAAEGMRGATGRKYFGGCCYEKRDGCHFSNAEVMMSGLTGRHVYHLGWDKGVQTSAPGSKETKMKQKEAEANATKYREEKETELAQHAAQAEKAAFLLFVEAELAFNPKWN